MLNINVIEPARTEGVSKIVFEPKKDLYHVFASNTDCLMTLQYATRIQYLAWTNE